MVCIPCIVIPALLFVWHKWIQPILAKIWNPFGIFGTPRGIGEEYVDPNEAKLTKLNQSLINDVTATFLQPKNADAAAGSAGKQSNEDGDTVRNRNKAATVVNGDHSKID